jgi:CRISPR-associated protein Cas5h
MAEKLISVDFKSNFGFFRKPDINSGIQLSYNMIHKPALLGIIGAIIGLKGYTKKGEVPVYYQELETLKVGVQPLNHEKGNYTKMAIKYTDSTGFNNVDKDKKPATRLIEEGTLIAPAYRCFFLLDMSNVNSGKIYDYLKNGYAEYIPYFGKNEFAASWSNFQEYDFVTAEEEDNSTRNVITLVLRNNKIFNDQKQVEFDLLNLEDLDKKFLYFERLPVGFDRVLNQYDLQEFAYSTFRIKSPSMPNLYLLKLTGEYVQLL